MHVKAILESKGDHVATISGEATVTAALEQLAREGIGALVVVEAGKMAGILSERDVVRRLASEGHSALEARVDELMTREVHTCEPSHTVEALMTAMTDRRIRHLPVLDDGELVGIISIGDVVKFRLGELETENQVMHDYIATGRG